MGSINGSAEVLAPTPRYIAKSYNHADSQASALRLVLTLNPHWEGGDNKIEFVRFTDGITNTVRGQPLRSDNIDGLIFDSFSKL
jgi:ethanolamine kinase